MGIPDMLWNADDMLDPQRSRVPDATRLYLDAAVAPSRSRAYGGMRRAGQIGSKPVLTPSKRTVER
jgi:hypothetical protein